MNTPSNLTAWERWELASFDDSRPKSESAATAPSAPVPEADELRLVKLPTAEEIEQIHQHAAIYLNPEDASLLRSYMGDQLSHAGHRIHEDFKLARGDCILEAGGSQLDATVAMRWKRVVEGLGIASAWEAAPVESAGNARADQDEP